VMVRSPPQGTLAGRTSCRRAGIPAFLPPYRGGTVVEEGKGCPLDRRPPLILARALPGDCALVAQPSSAITSANSGSGAPAATFNR